MDMRDREPKHRSLPPFYETWSTYVRFAIQ